MSNILGFKYCEEQADITLSPPKGDRKIAFLVRRKDQEVANNREDEKFEWKQVIDPYHDSNKIYANFRAVPASSLTPFPTLEDLGIEAGPFLAHPLETFASVGRDNVEISSFIGSGWMSSNSKESKQGMKDGCVTQLLLIFGDSVGKMWQVSKMEITSNTNISDPNIYDIGLRHFDIIIPVVKPKRLESSKGVYFVG